MDPSVSRDFPTSCFKSENEGLIFCIISLIFLVPKVFRVKFHCSREILTSFSLSSPSFSPLSLSVGQFGDEFIMCSFGDYQHDWELVAHILSIIRAFLSKNKLWYLELLFILIFHLFSLMIFLKKLWF